MTLVSSVHPSVDTYTRTYLLTYKHTYIHTFHTYIISYKYTCTYATHGGICLMIASTSCGIPVPVFAETFIISSGV